MFYSWYLIFTIFLIPVVYVVKTYLKLLYDRKKLECWMPSIPRVPLLGSWPYIPRSSTETFKYIEQIIDNPSKSAYVEIVGTKMICTKDYDLIEFILSSHTMITKSARYKSFEPWLGKGLVVASGSRWKSHRKIITPAFHFSILEQFVAVFDFNENVLVQKLRREAVDKDSIDIYEYVNSCALDIICESAMGVCLDESHEEYRKAVKSMCGIVDERATSHWKNINFLYQFCESYKTQCTNLKILHGFTNSVIQKRKKATKENGNINLVMDDLGRKRKMAFLDLLLNSRVNGRPLTDEEIREEVDTFMFAGHDTTSSVIAAAFFVLTEKPEIQTALRKELKEHFGKDKNRPMTLQDFQDLKYLDIVAKETLRLYPAAPMISRLIDEDTLFKGHVIPKGTTVLISIYGINRDPKYHKDPETFNPERFTATGNHTPYAYIPFSAGLRNCIGQRYAMLKLKTMIAKLLMNFELMPTNPPHAMKLAVEVVMKSVNGVRIKLREFDWESQFK